MSNMERLFEIISSDKAFYNGLKKLGIIMFFFGFYNAGLWAYSAMCFAGMAFIGKPKD